MHKRRFILFSRAFSHSSFRQANMQSMAEINTSAKLAPVKVLVIGGSYGGLAAALNLLDLCQGKAARFSAGQTPSTTLSVKTPVRIRIVDERDGFCEFVIILACEMVADVDGGRSLDRLPAGACFQGICSKGLG